MKTALGYTDSLTIIIILHALFSSYTSVAGENPFSITTTTTTTTTTTPPIQIIQKQSIEELFPDLSVSLESKMDAQKALLKKQAQERQLQREAQQRRMEKKRERTKKRTK